MSESIRFSCLIVDDDASFVSMLAKVVREEGGEVVHCLDLAATRDEIAHGAFDIVLLDNRLPDGTGYEFFPELARRLPLATIIMITGLPELSQAIQLTRSGVWDYLTKPLDVGVFAECLRRAKRRVAQPDLAAASGELTGDSTPIRAVVHSLRQAARHVGATVLLLGETGVGKDLAARMLHRFTYAHVAGEHPYVPVNCSAVPAEMFEAELFGSERGAYTGADKRRVGLAEAADGGTLFLDEITEMPVSQQSKLLRFLESREFRTLGGGALRDFSGRIVAATNRSLPDEVKNGRFREDLMFRLTVAPIRIPPLRERMSDLDNLVECVLLQLGQKYQRKRTFLKPGDLEVMRSYPFPGNVRELRNLLERALLNTPDDSSWLNFDATFLGSAPAATPAAATNSGSPLPSRQMSALELQEFRMIQEALRSEGGGIRRAAARLGITHQTLLRRLQKWPELRQAPQRTS